MSQCIRIYYLSFLLTQYPLSILHGMNFNACILHINIWDLYLTELNSDFRLVGSLALGNLGWTWVTSVGNLGWT